MYRIDFVVMGFIFVNNLLRNIKRKIRYKSNWSIDTRNEQNRMSILK